MTRCPCLTMVRDVVRAEPNDPKDKTMPKSRSRRRRSDTAKSLPPPSLETDLSVVVEGEKVIPDSVRPDDVDDGETTPRLTVETRTGKPIIKLARSSANREPAGTARPPEVVTGHTNAHAPAPSSGSFGPDGTPVDMRQPTPPAENATEAADAGAGDDLRQIAQSVALSPIPESPPSKRALDQLRALFHRAADTCQDTFDAAKRFLARHDIRHPRDIGRHLAASQTHLAQVALALRIGLGALFVVGGVNKLSKLLSPAASDQIVASYTSTTGYINEFFMAFLFAPGAALTPWSFLTALSTFELVTGIMLLAGLLVRPVALIYAFLLWTFVIALPVVTTNGVDPGVRTYMAPAILVQIRDIALSGFMFVLYGLGSGLRSLDYRLFGPEALQPVMSWPVASLLLRLSVAVVLIVGGLFAGMPSIKTYFEPGLLLVAIALAVLWGGTATRYAAGVVCGVLFVYMLGKIGIDKGLIGSLNAIKRELALFAGAFVLAARESGQFWTASDIARRLTDGVQCARQNMTSAPTNLKPAE